MLKALWTLGLLGTIIQIKFIKVLEWNAPESYYSFKIGWKKIKELVRKAVFPIAGFRRLFVSNVFLA